MNPFINYIGKRGKLIDGSIMTTEWNCLIIPLYPLASFRIWLNGKEPNFFYQRTVVRRSLYAHIPLDWINVTMIYSVYLFIAAFAAFLFQKNTFVIIFAIAFACVYALNIVLKYDEKKFYEIDKTRTFECERCKGKFNILKLNIKHKYFKCPKCEMINSFLPKR
jgi:hypothetical protein